MFDLKEKLLISIITKNDSSKLDRLLDSIFRHPVLNQMQIFILDSSSDKQYILSNQQILNKYPTLTIKIVNKFDWETVKTAFTQSLNSSSDFTLLQSFKIGAENYNCPDNRNVQIFLLLYYYPHKKHVLFLDDDMLVTEKFSLSKYHLRDLVGLKIIGCPDFSRIQWIRFYLLYLSKKHNIKLRLQKRNLTDNTFCSITLLKTAFLIKNYTDLYVADDHHLVSTPLTFHTRGFDTGSFICNSKYFNKIMYPLVFPEQMIWLNILIKRGVRLTLSKQKIIHASSKKSVLQFDTLKYELEGIVIQEFFLSKLPLTETNMQKARNNLIKDVSLYLGIGKKIYSKYNPSQKFEKDQLITLLECLLKVKTYLLEQKIDQYLSISSEYIQNNIKWRKIAKLLDRKHISTYT